jgi:hypothetical protein
MHYSVWIFLTKEVFVLNFRKNSSAAGCVGRHSWAEGAVKRLLLGELFLQARANAEEEEL